MTASDPDWVADQDMDEELTAKCLALKIHGNRLRALVESSQRTDEDMASKGRALLKLLRLLISENGEMAKSKSTPEHYRSKLRLIAAQLSLKLCTLKDVDAIYSGADFNNLAVVAQDKVPQVRHRFIETIQKYLGQRKLPLRFYTVVFMTAFEPVTDFKARIETWLRSMARGTEATDSRPVMEATMARLLSLLAHHPDYSADHLDDLADHARYIAYYVNIVATESNLGLVHAYADKVKQVNDAIDPQKSDRLRVLSDIAQALLGKWQHRKGWVFQAYSQKIGLPIGLFKPLGSHEEAQRIAEKQYMPPELDEELDRIIRGLEKKVS